MAEISSLTRQEGADTDELPSLTIGNSDFPLIRQDGTLFVDKTAKIPRLLRYKKVFFARPRRFGKTTLASMLFELFMHGTEKFEGLAVYDTWPVKQCYPTIMISLYGLDQPEVFEATLCEKLSVALKDAGLFDLYDRTKAITQLGAFFVEVKSDLAALNTVWLIDEWDFPLSANLDNRPAFDANTQVLQKLFSNLRDLRNLRFMLVTGIMRYQNTSLFSGQDIVNISMNRAFADLLGYTQTELEANFAPYIERAAQLLDMSREDFLEKLKLYYDGFYFDSKTSVSLYCPWSINSFFQQVIDNPDDEPSFANFWMNSAGAAVALSSFLQVHCVKPELLEQALSSKLQVASTEFNEKVAFEKLTLPSIMVQSGYLTIKQLAKVGTGRSKNTYDCGFPNLEVASEFADVALAVSMSSDLCDQSEFNHHIDELRNAVRAQDMATMARALNSLLVGIGYDAWSSFIESHYRSFISLCLIAASSHFVTREETYNSHGRSDIELEADGRLLVIELKRLPAKAGASKQACLALAEVAQNQIIDHRYSQNSATLQKPPFKERNAAVLVISEKHRQIVYWRLLSLDKVKLKQDPLLGEGWVVPLPLEESAEDKAAAADDGKKQNRSKKKSVKRGAAKQDVASDESQVATSGKVTPIKGEKDAGAAPSGEGEASAAACAGTASKPQSEVKTNPSLDKTDLFMAFNVAQQLADSADNVVTLDSAMLARGLQAYVVMMHEQNDTCSQEQLKNYVERYIDKIQQVSSPEKAKTFDRSYLVQDLVALLTKVL